MKTTFGLPKKREQVINMLQQAYIEQNLEDEEYGDRLKSAMEAKSVEDLQIVIADFPGNPQLLAPKKNAKSTSSPDASFSLNAPFQLLQKKLTNVVATGNSKQSIALLSSKVLDISEGVHSPLRVTTYLGEQKVSLQNASVVGDTLVISIETGLGSTIIDLRGKNLANKHIQINLMVIFGEVSILLPKGAQVNNQITPVLGEVTHSYQKVKKWIKKFIGGQKAIETTPIPYTINLYGSCVLGSVALVHD